MYFLQLKRPGLRIIYVLALGPAIEELEDAWITLHMDIDALELLQLHLLDVTLEVLHALRDHLLATVHHFSHLSVVEYVHDVHSNVKFQASDK